MVRLLSMRSINIHTKKSYDLYADFCTTTVTKALTKFLGSYFHFV